MGAGRSGGRGPDSLTAVNIFLRGSEPDGYSSRGPSMTDSSWVFIWRNVLVESSPTLCRSFISSRSPAIGPGLR